MERCVLMNEVPQQLTFKLLFGLLEGTATGSLAVSCFFALGVLILVGKGIAGVVTLYRTRSNIAQKKRK